eukprot:scaffold20148_cov59-Attheya_sp.AAC.3
MATSRHHAAANGTNSDQPPNDDIIQTDSAGVHTDTGVDSTSVRHDQRWWQSDQEGISLLATAGGGAVDAPSIHENARLFGDEDNESEQVDEDEIEIQFDMLPRSILHIQLHRTIPHQPLCTPAFLMRFHVFLMTFERCSYKHGTFNSQRNGN